MVEPMRYLRNEKGIALITALLLTLISLAIVMAVLYFITQGIELSAANKRYKSSLDAAHGGVQVLTKDVMPKVMSSFNTYSTSTLKLEFASINLDPLLSNACLKQKLESRTANWTACGGGSSTLDAKVAADFSFILRGTSMSEGYKVFTKIVDTSPGNSDASGAEGLLSGDSVTGSPSGLSPMHLPAKYRIEVQGEKENNPKERARLSVLYAY